MVITTYYVNSNGRLREFRGEDKIYIVGRLARTDVPGEPYGVYIMDERGYPIVYTGNMDLTVSRNHLKLYQDGERLKVIDWGYDGTGSKNGTIVVERFKKPSNLEEMVERLTKRKVRMEDINKFNILRGDYIDVGKGECVLLQPGINTNLAVCKE
ncbi:MAG: hypothetical protein BXU00_03115 [Candidatus Nanoclepta minutus]|uniref:FHA domain-containing protein n=1 Tax=Candidatus Nanoclepta minutus TaxID=1940235 RepID=A0A397WMM1_9ARCH|nr:MAG: hypothetical protein BXU00_03115 [Candidatus Nanoclepta minutus]